MGNGIRDHIRSNIVGYVAVFLALSGTAYAVDGPLAGQDTVGSADIINGEVKTGDIGDLEVKRTDVAPDSLGSAKIADRSVKNADLSIGASSSNTIADGGIQNVDVANNTLTGAKVQSDSLTGTEVDESSLNLPAEGWHEVGTPGESVFRDTGFCAWKNFDANHNSAAYLRDRHGIVHLKGLVDVQDFGCDFGIAVNREIVVLPFGYRPERREVHASISNGALARVNVDGPNPFGGSPGAVSVGAPTTLADAKQWVSLDGITFRCAPSGSNGCP